MVERLEKITLGEGLYRGVFYYSPNGPYKIYGKGFDFKWKAIPRERKDDHLAINLMIKILNYGTEYSIRENLVPRLIRGFSLDGIDCIFVRIDGEKEEMI